MFYHSDIIPGFCFQEGYHHINGGTFEDARGDVDAWFRRYPGAMKAAARCETWHASSERPVIMPVTVATAPLTAEGVFRLDSKLWKEVCLMCGYVKWLC